MGTHPLGRTDEGDLQPTMVPFQVVTQQRRRTDIVGHRQVEIAVLVDVHRGAAPTDTGQEQAVAGPR